MLLITIQWAILSDTHSRLHQLTDEAWIQTLREFLQLSDLQIEKPQIQCPTPKRIHDNILMDCVPARNSSQKITNKINRCRIYLKAETLSDLCTADGMRTNARHKGDQLTPATGPTRQNRDRPTKRNGNRSASHWDHGSPVITTCLGIPGTMMNPNTYTTPHQLGQVYSATHPPPQASSADTLAQRLQQNGSTTNSFPSK
jgi:hypothetical protein